MNKFTNQIISMTWTKKLEQFALSCKLRQSDERLLRWLLRRAKRDRVDEIEIDLRVFNKFIERDRGRPYDRKTVKTALWRLDELTQGMVLVTKSYTWAIHKIIIRPLEMIQKQNSQSGDGSPRLNRGNPMFSDAHKEQLVKQQQQDISKIDFLLQNVGLKYDRDALNKIYRLAGKKIESVVKAIELMLYRHSNSEITKPHGFIISCLTHCWQDGFDLYYQPELPKFVAVKAIADYVRDICTRSPIACQT